MSSSTPRTVQIQIPEMVIPNPFFVPGHFSALVMFVGVYWFYIFRWISHAVLDISTLFVNVSALSAAFLRTSVLYFYHEKLVEIWYKCGRNLPKKRVIVLQ